MSTHNICFRGEIRKISILFGLEKSALTSAVNPLKVEFTHDCMVLYCTEPFIIILLSSQYDLNGPWTFKDSKGPDQPAHMPSLIRDFAVP